MKCYKQKKKERIVQFKTKKFLLKAQAKGVLSEQNRAKVQNVLTMETQHFVMAEYSGNTH